MKKETYQAPMIEEADSKLLFEGVVTSSNPDPDDNTGEI